MSNRGVYRVQGEDLEDLQNQLNEVLQFISERLDNLTASGTPEKISGSVVVDKDIVIVNTDRGLILRDDGDPPNYWRLQIVVDGDLEVTNLGNYYENSIQ